MADVCWVLYYCVYVTQHSNICWAICGQLCGLRKDSMDTHERFAQDNEVKASYRQQSITVGIV